MGKKDRICVRAREVARAHTHTQTKTNTSHKDMQADKCFNYVEVARGTRRRGRVWLVKHLNIT